MLAERGCGLKGVVPRGEQQYIGPEKQMSTGVPVLIFVLRLPGSARAELLFAELGENAIQVLN